MMEPFLTKFGFSTPWAASLTSETSHHTLAHSPSTTHTSQPLQWRRTGRGTEDVLLAFNRRIFVRRHPDFVVISIFGWSVSRAKNNVIVA